MIAYVAYIHSAIDNFIAFTIMRIIEL
jgi:hypothetical protein